ncbi:D-alanine--D-alanine ligase family protein [Leptospira sp. GIMC2001]|uniref:D-alanine--D-alanine ligase family protein n=1 Tax=Leptospira sp. GIMC2001 TaxID=1513297 RepID=UPI002349160D|nr:hypothetical protein [Leptospira sp. GIMC2001]WCL47953.1 hypothetical protein O4O04_11540 [Leptospira sp. GIMC2001]
MNPNKSNDSQIQCLLACDIYPKDNKESKNIGTQEWESIESIEYLSSTIEKLGYQSYIIDSPKNLIHRLNHINLNQRNKTIIWNLVEGYQSRNRESYIPSIAEYLGICHTGSDSYAQAICLDKSLTKQKAQAIGIPIAEELGILTLSSQGSEIDRIIESGKLWNGKGNDQNFKTWFAKPNGEGSGLGVGQESIIKQVSDLKFYIKKYSESFREILIEEYLEGNEYSVAMLETSFGKWEICSALIQYPDVVYGEEVKRKDCMPETFLLEFDKSKKKAIEQMSLEFVMAMGIEGYARLDFRDDHAGNVKFLEANITPGLSKFYSLLPKMFESSLLNYESIIQNIITTALENFSRKPRYNYGKHHHNN